MPRRIRAAGYDYITHADMHAATGPDPVTGGGGGGYATVRDEGVSLTARTVLNFTGAGVTVTDNSTTSATDVTIPSGAGTPAVSVVAETTYGQASVVGTSTNYARQDHTHGTPSLPVTTVAFATLAKWGTD